MSRFGQTLFGRSGFIRWTLTPIVLLFAVFMPLSIEAWTLVRVVLMAVMEMMCLCLLAGFWLPERMGHRAFRLLAGMVALCYVGYCTDQFFFSDEPVDTDAPRRRPSPLSALVGFLVIGYPCLRYALTGSFSENGRRPAESHDGSRTNAMNF